MQWFRRRLDWERETWEQGSSQKGRRRSTTDQGMRSTTDQGRMRSRDQGRIGMEKGTRSARWAGEEERRSQTCLTPVRFPNPLATGHSWQLGNLTRLLRTTSSPAQDATNQSPPITLYCTPEPPPQQHSLPHKTSSHHNHPGKSSEKAFSSS